MKLKNGEIFEAKEPLQSLLDQKLPVVISYKLAKMSHKLNEQLKVIENVRNGLVTKHGKPNNNGQASIRPGDENWKQFVEEIDELMAMEVEIVIEKVKLPEKIDDKPLLIEPKVLMFLDKFVEI